MPDRHIRVFANSEELAAEAAAFVAEQSAAAIEARGRFVVALSGGSTPRRLHALLAGPPWASGLDWARWHVFVGDERLLPVDLPDSNFGAARASLLAHVPIPAAQLHPVPTDAGTPDEVARAYEADLRAALGVEEGGVPHFDLILLGLGSDGHTASLFPDRPALEEARRLVTWSEPGVLPPPVTRVTLTFPVLNAARAVAFLVAGSDKAPAVKDVFANAASELPAARVRPTDGTLDWFLDAAAYAGLA